MILNTNGNIPNQISYPKLAHVGNWDEGAVYNIRERDYEIFMGENSLAAKFSEQRRGHHTSDSGFIDEDNYKT